MYTKRHPGSLGEREQEMCSKPLCSFAQIQVIIGYHSRVDKAWAPPSDLDGKPGFRLTFSGSLDKLLLYD